MFLGFRIGPACLALAVVGPGLGAAEVVQFTDGRSMRVEAVRPGPEATELWLEGGGRIAVPSSRIRQRAPWSEPAPRTSTGEGVDSTAAWRAVAGDFAEVIEQAAERHELDPALLTAVAQAESAFDPGAVSPKGAQGLLQLMPDTAERFGVDDAFDVAQNVDGGARYLRWLLERYPGRTDLALAGYNAGEGKVDRFRGIPPYRETRAYVSKVLAGADRMRATSR